MKVEFQNKTVCTGWRLLLPVAVLTWSGIACAMYGDPGDPGDLGSPGVGSESGQDATPEVNPDVNPDVNLGAVSRESGRVEPQGRGEAPWWRSWWKPRARVGDERNGAPSPRKPGIAGDDSKLDEKIVAHSDATQVRELIDFLVPHGWRVHFDVEASQLDREIVFHAETTRRRALDQLCLSLGLKGIFYPYKRLVLIVEGRSQ